MPQCTKSSRINLSPHPPFESFLYKTQRYYWTSTITWGTLHQTDLALARPNTNFLKHSFNYNGAILWNNISYVAKTVQSLSKFKSKLASFPSAGISVWFINLHVCIFKTYTNYSLKLRPTQLYCKTSHIEYIFNFCEHHAASHFVCNACLHTPHLEVSFCCLCWALWNKCVDDDVDALWHVTSLTLWRGGGKGRQRVVAWMPVN